MRLVVGLGNPGERYRLTRHNVGFRVIDALCARTGAVGQVEGDAWLADSRIADVPVRLVKPLAYMNRSGSEVARLLEATGSSAQELVVVVDDVALELGTVRVRERGSHGGHNGLRSICEVLATSDWARVRVGVREPGRPLDELPDELADYVLSAFPPEQAPAVEASVAMAADATECLVREGAAVAMNLFNGRRA